MSFSEALVEYYGILQACSTKRGDSAHCGEREAEALRPCLSFEIVFYHPTIIACMQSQSSPFEEQSKRSSDGQKITTEYYGLVSTCPYSPESNGGVVHYVAL